MLSLENISVSFGENHVLRNVSFDIKEGDFIALMGHNGAGKSTLFDVIAGKITPDAGRVLIDGKDVTHLTEAERAPLIGRLLQNIALGTVGSMTVAENLAIATLKNRTASLSPGIKAFPKNVVEEVLAPLQLNLEKQLDSPMASLSGGQRQVIAFVMATLVKPRFLLLDEPTAALDPESSVRLLDFARSYALQNKIPTLLITHDREIASTYGSQQWQLTRTQGLSFGKDAHLSPRQKGAYAA